MEMTDTYVNRQQEIIRASAALFDRVGYHGASMNMIAEAVNLGKPTLYHYFRSKSEILFAMHRELMSVLVDAHNARQQETSRPDELLRGLCYDTIKFIVEHPGYTRAFFEHYHDLDESQRSALSEHRKSYLNMVIELIRSGIKDGLFAECDVRNTALAFLGACNWTYQWMPSDRRLDVSAVAENLSRLFLSGLMRR
ncbi:TetR/AcrR family transcriptional regulator [Parahaliea maris]|nr:TetR/AcrR family transcriptional regulator [Parahaliea maris]